MHVVTARNVNDAYIRGAQLIKEIGVMEETRNGPAFVVQEPVCTHYQQPQEKVLLEPIRDANPFFHLFESLWILSGRNDVDWISRFTKHIKTFSDNGTQFHGAYGYRLRRVFGINQIKIAIQMLTDDPTSRRVYLSMYHPAIDLGIRSKDIPCNVGIKFELKHHKLNMIVFNRSNDMVWGAYGANAVHFAMLQEYVAMKLDAEIGWYEQISANFHSYVDTWEKHKLTEVAFGGYQDPYEHADFSPLPLLQEQENVDDWDMDLIEFVKEAQLIHPTREYKTEFFRGVASPMLDAWEGWEDKQDGRAFAAADQITASDWRKASDLWLRRRKWISTPANLVVS